MNTKGRFGKFGGQYVPEIVMPALNELEENYAKYKDFLNRCTNSSTILICSTEPRKPVQMPSNSSPFTAQFSI